MASLNFTPTNVQASGTGTTTWTDTEGLYISKYNLIRLTYSSTAFNTIPSSANISSIVITFSATNNTTSSSQTVNLYLQTTNKTPANSQSSSELLGSFDQNFANNSTTKQTITKTLTSGSTDFNTFISWMNYSGTKYITLHAPTSSSPQMTYANFSITVYYTASKIHYYYNGWKEADSIWAYTGSKWEEITAENFYGYNGSRWYTSKS